MSIDINFVVGGEAGQGVQSIGLLLARIFTRSGYFVFADQDYESRIRGGHNFFRVRVKDTEVGAISETIHILIALNNETISIHQYELDKGAIVIIDDEKLPDLSYSGKLFGVPLQRLAREKAGNEVMANTVALGVALGLVKCKLDTATEVVKDFYGNSEIAASNVIALTAGYQYAEQNFVENVNQKVSVKQGMSRMLINGNEAVALGALAAGCKFMAAYPMTPSTSIMEYLAAKSDDFGVVVVQPEDEIAAVNMIIGASFAGVRAMTATSGSGFCLMVEGLGMAGISETPVVIIDGQRPGPAVGLPTRTEQGDLLFAIHAHHGDFPRAVLAPATVEEAFWLTVKAFNLADRYQIPVIMLTDQYLATCYQSIDTFDVTKVLIDRGSRYSEHKHGDKSDYKRHLITESGISPRAFPGEENIVVVTDADEHNESGHLNEDAQSRTQQMQKRLRKLIPMKKDISAPVLYGPKDAETMLIGWGSTYGALREAVSLMLEDGASMNMLHISELWPFPAEEVVKALNSVQNSFIVENNATGQLAQLIKAETGISVNDRILRFDGRPITPEKIIVEMKGV